ncbi:hypothetical protein [Terribacillus saccharophilus]|nr:hypothetical protein [Terribacillus saccharophilus]
MLEIILLGVALAAAPGPDFLLMTRNTLSQGKRLTFGYFFHKQTKNIA